VISQELKRYIQDSFRNGKLVAFSGAGISAESGVPTFRGKDGLWERYPPQNYATTEGLKSAFKKQPQSIVDFISDFYSLLLKAQPNPAHYALMVLEKENILGAVITQNIDNLHQAAGSRNVIELHGNALRLRCMGCSKQIVFERDRLKEMIELLRNGRDSRVKLLKVLSRYFPRCACGCRYRFDIVLFCEMLPERELSLAYEQLDNCKTLLIIGSSLAVYPAAGLPLYAKQRGAKLIEINNQPSAFSDLCDYRVVGSAGNAMVEILNTLEIDTNV
jgi:NAD-dependent deacetylase